MPCLWRYSMSRYTPMRKIKAADFPCVPALSEGLKNTTYRYMARKFFKLTACLLPASESSYIYLLMSSYSCKSKGRLAYTKSAQSRTLVLVHQTPYFSNICPRCGWVLSAHRSLPLENKNRDPPAHAFSMCSQSKRPWPMNYISELFGICLFVASNDPGSQKSSYKLMTKIKDCSLYVRSVSA